MSSLLKEGKREKKRNCDSRLLTDINTSNHGYSESALATKNATCTVIMQEQNSLFQNNIL